MSKQPTSAAKKYALARNVVESDALWPIAEAEYRELAEAHNGLMVLLFLEEKFDLVAESYLEFENSLLNSTLEHITNDTADYKWFSEKRANINRRLLNLLNAATGYLDFVRQAVRKLAGRNS